MTPKDNLPLSSDEEKRLFDSRGQSHEECPAPEDPLVIPPDVAPEKDVVPCDPPEVIPPEEYLDPNIPPAEAPSPSDLPEAITILSRMGCLSCDTEQIALGGDTPTEVPQGYDIQLAFLDDITEIQTEELYRIAGTIPELQQLVDAEFIDAYERDDTIVPGWGSGSCDDLIVTPVADPYADFDAAVADLLRVTLPVAVLIRESFVEAQMRADDIATSYAQSLLICGYQNRELWVACASDSPLGYIVTFTDPTGGSVDLDNLGMRWFVGGYIAYKKSVEAIDGPFGTISEGVFTSRVSQEDADAQAARQAALQLDCLIGNDEQTVTCADISESYDVDIAWPDDEDDSDTWETTSQVPLSTFNERKFSPEETLGTGEGRTLRYTVTIQAGDDRAAAATKEEANEIAMALALAELDCFFPSRPRKVDCSSPGEGNDDVISRKSARGYSDSQMFSEMSGGSVTDGGEPYNRYNHGIINPGTENEAVDTTNAYEVISPAGIYVGDNEESTNESAATRAISYLLCVWVSPKHTCTCVGPDTPSSANVSSKFTSAEVLGNGANFKPSESSPIPAGETSPKNTLERGLFVSDVFPGPDMSGNTVWPDLPSTCTASLTCVFDSCKIVYCEPKPDTRQYKVNGMANYASYGEGWNSRPSTLSEQQQFISAWRLKRDQAIAEELAGADAPCQGYTDADPCGGVNDPSAITDIGPVDYGQPARFKYGGVLRIGKTWGSTKSEVLPGGVPLLASGTVLDCGIVPEGGVGVLNSPPTSWQEPELWGFYSGAEGYARALTPIDLGEQAAADAAGRLDCTHLAWPKVLINCPQPGQKQFGPVPFHLDMVVEGTSTADANEQAESLVLDMLQCRDAGNFNLTVDGSRVSLMSPVVAAAGDDCMDGGLHQAVLTDGSCEPIPGNGESMSANQSAHYFIAVTCCKGQMAKALQLIIVPDTDINYNDVVGARQKGEMGIPAGRQELEKIKQQPGGDELEIWYIGSLYYGGDPSGFPHGGNRITVQAYSGPIIIGDSCCDEGSSDSDSDSDSGSGGEGSQPPIQPSSSPSESSKSTAIIQDPLGEHEKDFMAVFTVEAKDVRFEETQDYLIPKGSKVREHVYEINPRYVRSNEIDTIRMCSAVDENGRTVRAVLSDNNHVIRFYPTFSQRFRGSWNPGRVTVRLSAIRKGFIGKQHSRRSALQRDECEATLNSAYSGYSDD